MPTEVLAPISAGELFDKISILEIKLEHITAPDKVANISHELSLLRSIASSSSVSLTDEARDLLAKLKAINFAIWEGEDQIRNLDSRGIFDDLFVQTARSIRRLNDARASIKKAVNETLDSSVIEEKSFSVQSRISDRS